MENTTYPQSIIDLAEKALPILTARYYERGEFLSDSDVLDVVDELAPIWRSDDGMTTDDDLAEQGDPAAMLRLSVHVELSNCLFEQLAEAE